MPPFRPACSAPRRDGSPRALKELTNEATDEV
jgi:hypothetical protein